MKALVRDRYGLPDVLEVREVERPAPGEGEVLVRVYAASINDWDWGLLQGPTLPFLRTPPKSILGSDVAGRVVALGSGCGVYGRLCSFTASFEYLPDGSAALRVTGIQ